MADHDHQCAWGCGNVADNILVNLNTSEADILCTPCFLRLANDISQAWMKELEEKGLADSPKAAIVDGDTATLSEASLEVLSPELPAPSTSTLSGSVSGSSVPAITAPDSDDPPEYETPEPDPNYGFAPSVDVPPCPTCDQVNGHAPGCIFT